MSSDMENIKEAIREAIKPTEMMVRELHCVRFKRGLNGDPPDGIRLDRLEQESKRRRMWTMAAVSAGVMSVVGTVWALITGK
jgi:hypothetical protein